jgi:hypothetical protein
LDYLNVDVPSPVPSLLVSPKVIATEPIKANAPPNPNGIVAQATPNRKRKKSMSFRSGQSGTVVCKGQMWHGRYYVDTTGVEERRRASMPLGSIRTMTKPQAKRKLRAALQEMGLNDDTYLEHTNAVAKTFIQEATWWKANHLSILKPSSQETMGSHIDKYLLPRFGKLSMAAIDERRVQEFIDDLIPMEHVWPNGRAGESAPKLFATLLVC